MSNILISPLKPGGWVFDSLQLLAGKWAYVSSSSTSAPAAAEFPLTTPTVAYSTSYTKSST